MINSIFFDLGIIIIVATAIAFVARFFKQPLIPAYVLAGLLIGPLSGLLLKATFLGKFFHGNSIIGNSSVIATFSEIGIAFLLFIVGLEIDLKRLKDVGKVAIIGGILEIIGITAISYLILVLMHVGRVESIYLGLVVAFSSTMVIIKILSDKKELDTLHGKIVLGILLLQDMFAIFALFMLGQQNSMGIASIITSVITGLLIFLSTLFISGYVFPYFFRFAAKSQELLFLASLSVCFLFSIVFEKIGFSISIGAFVAGLSLANLPYNFEIIGRVKSLRDFFATLFFVSLGMELIVADIGKIILPFVILFLVVVVLKPFFTIIIISMFGYKKRTSFLTAISLAQISEFSLILVTEGYLLGQLSKDILTLTILLAITTISLSSYFMKFEYKIYFLVSNKLNIFERINSKENSLEYVPKRKKEVVLVGYDRTGYSILKKLVNMKKDFIVIDYNPTIIKRLIKDNIPCIYGDASNPEVINKIDFKEVKTLISTIPDEETSLFLIRTARKANKKVMVFVTAYDVDEALDLYDAGADYVILPHFLGGHHASLLLEEATVDYKKLVRERKKHIRELSHRKRLGHKYPVLFDHYFKNKKAEKYNIE